MPRITKPGISYYSFDVDVVLNKKIKLLFTDFDSNGFWVWSCLLSKIYNEKGYYYDISDREEFTLFATDVCKKPVTLVDDIINGCIRRGLFDKSIFEKFNVLTSDRIQSNYLEATKDRRKKGTTIEFIEDYLVINLPDNEPHISIIQEERINSQEIMNSSREETVNSLEESLQSKVKKSKVKKSKVNNPPQEKSGGGKKDDNYISDLLEIFKEEYVLARGYEPELLTAKEERALAKIQSHYRSKNQNKKSDEAKEDMRKYFKKCLAIKDRWHYENMSPTHILNQMTTINSILRTNGGVNNGTKFPTRAEIKAASGRN